MRQRRNRKNRSRRRSHRRRYRRVRHNPVMLFGRRRRSHRRRRHNRHHRRHRRNPSFGSLTSNDTLSLVGGGAVGFFGSRYIPQNVSMLAQYNTGITGYALTAGIGLALSWLLKRFWSARAATGALVGTGLAVLERIVVDNLGAATPSGSTSQSGDLNFDLGYYAAGGFPMAQGPAAGPWGTFPGTPWGGAAYLPTAATAVAAGQRAAAAALPAAGGSPMAANAANLPGGPGSDSWASSWA